MRKWLDLFETRSTSAYAIKGGEVILSVKEMRGDRYSVLATVDGREAATAEFQADWLGRGSIEEIVVNTAFRRRGIARAIYDHFEKMGFTVVPSNDIRPDGQAFWRDRRG